MAGIEVSKNVHGLPGAAIDAEAIERELSNLWRMPPVVSLHERAITPSRTSVLNLILYAPDRTAAARLSRVVGQLVAHHPARVLIFVGVPQTLPDPTDLDARVFAHCHVSDTEPVAFCFEQVTIPIPTNALALLASVVPPLVVPDLPTVLWWPTHPPLHDPAFAHLTGKADRLIVDSLAFNRAVPTLMQLATFCRRIHPAGSVSDLNWPRLTTWREMTAQLFDLPDYHWALNAITRVTVGYGHARGATDNPTQALLFLGWVASRLGWQTIDAEPAGPDLWAFTARRPDGSDVRLELQRTPVARDFNGFMLSASLAATDGHRSADVSAARVAKANMETIRLQAAVDGVQTMEHTARCTAAEPGSLLIQELSLRQAEPLFTEALAEAQQLAMFMRNQGQ